MQCASGLECIITVSTHHSLYLRLKHSVKSLYIYTHIFVLQAICFESIHKLLSALRDTETLYVCAFLQGFISARCTVLELCTITAPIQVCLRRHPQESNILIIFTRGSRILSECELFSRVISLLAPLLIRI